MLSLPASRSQRPAKPAGRLPCAAPSCAGLPLAGWLLALVLVTAALFAIPQRAQIPPTVEADNAYIFLAADRLWAGKGVTSIPPRAPLQPWSWHADWVFLTQWPLGYPVLICAARAITGAGTVQAAVALNIVCCALGLVGWFAWGRTCLPRSRLAWLLALTASAATFAMPNLVNPSSDTVLLGALPWTLLLAARGLGRDTDGTMRPSSALLGLTGIAAGLLIWVRYAAIFAPLAIGIYLVGEWRLRRGLRGRQVVTYLLASAAPILTLVAINRALGPEIPTQQQYNLGSTLSWQIPPETLLAAWLNLTRQTPYAHRPEAVWFIALLLPLVGVALPILLRPLRSAAKRLWTSPPALLSLACMLTLLLTLVTASALFQGKYNYAELARYYQPARPLYYLCFVGPLVLAPWRWWRAGIFAGLLLTCSWLINQDARRAHVRLLAREVEVTDYGRAARHFAPGSRELFAWLRELAGPELVVFSNFHEEIALETGIPASPTPRDDWELQRWLGRIRQARGVEDLRVLFVLHPDNDYRDYYLDAPADIRRKFGLNAPADATPAVANYVFTSPITVVLNGHSQMPDSRTAADAPSRGSEPGLPGAQ